MNKKFIRSKTSSYIKYADNLEKLKSRRNIYTSHRSTSYGLGRKRHSGRLLSIRSEGDVEKEKAGILFEVIFQLQFWFDIQF